MKIKSYRLTKEAKLPKRNNPSDVGLDIFSIEDVFIPKGETRLVRTGVCIDVPYGFIGKIEDRSSMAKRGLRTGAGVVDPGFSGELSIVLHNLTCKENRDSVLYQEGYQIKVGDKIGQMVISPVSMVEVEEVDEIWESSRGNKGWGSSGR